LDKYIAPSVSVAAINRFCEKMREENCEIHTLQIYKDGRLMVRMSFPPYSCTDTPEVYSLSKTFTAAVVGIASDRGYLSADDYVLKYFPEIKTDCEYFHRMKIKHVLSMNTGHARCVMPEMAFSENAANGFFSVEPEFEPGTHFTYNSGATCLLGMIVSRATGMDFFDFASANLFYPLGIHNVSWGCCHDGSCQCGTGLHISSDDISKLFLMYLGGGIYNGKRILSEEWINESTLPISDTSANRKRDNSVGYGYQLWMNSQDGYRGSGSFGQLGIVLPARNAVVVITSMVSDMQVELDGISELMDDLERNGNEESKDYSFPPHGKIDLPDVNNIYKLSENAQGFETLHLTVDEDGVSMHFSYRDNFGYRDKSIVTLNSGNGRWLESSFSAQCMTSFITEIMPDYIPEKLRVASCVESFDGKLVLCMRYLTNPHTEYYNISYNDDELDIYVSDGIRSEEKRRICGKRIK